MAVRLQTEDGKIKEYKTTYPFSRGESLPDIYYTKCGRKWDNEPSSQEECKHLECAISIVNADRKHGPLIFVLLSAISVMLLQTQFQTKDKLVTIILFLLPAFYFLLAGLRARKRFIELTEYRDKGTINGIAAWQIFEDQEEAKAKIWWKFWG